jgi:glucose-1-phosphate cytidylyltransferase
MTAGRLKRIERYIDSDNFMLTYGDGVTDINIKSLVDFHNENNKICTMSVIQPGSRFGVIETNDKGVVTQFTEKPKEDGAWINGGYFVLNRKVFSYLKDDADEIMWERQPLEDLAKDGELLTRKHNGFWKCMDTVRDRDELEFMWMNKPKWKSW